MPEEEKSEEKRRESIEERRKEMREKMKEMHEERGGPGGMPPGGGLSAVMKQMAGARGGQQDRVMMETMKGLRADMKEIKEYLRKILESLEE